MTKTVFPINRDQNQQTLQIDMARKLAWSFSRTTGLEFEDLFQEACLAYMWALNDERYDPSKSKFTSFAYMKMRNWLSDYAESQYRARDLNLEGMLAESSEEDSAFALEDLLPSDEAGPEHALAFAEELGELSPEAKEICRMVMEEPSEYAQLGKRAGRGRVKDELRAKGWTWDRIWDGLRQAKAFANGLA